MTGHRMVLVRADDLSEAMDIGGDLSVEALTRLVLAQVADPDKTRERVASAGFEFHHDDKWRHASGAQREDWLAIADAILTDAEETP